MPFKSSRNSAIGWRQRMEGMLAGVGVRRFYVDATLGNDANSGRSPATAWQTIAKVNGSTFLPGDQIFFARGETWTGNLRSPSDGSAGTQILFGAYGSGARPIIQTGGAAWWVMLLDRDYITIRDIAFDGLNSEYPIVVLGATHSNVVNCEAYNSNEVGIYVSDLGSVTTSYILIQGNVVHDNGNEGIYVKNETAINGTSNVSVLSNDIYDCGDEGLQLTYSAPATAVPTGVVFRGNDLYGTFGDNGGTHIGGDATIEKNLFRGSGGNYGALFLSDGTGLIVRNNIIHDWAFNTAGSAGGIYLTGGAVNADIFYNTIYGVANAGAGTGFGIYVQAGNTGSEAKGNALSGNDNQMVLNAVVDADRNCIHGASADNGTNPVLADPLFVNIGADNYHLQSGSPCRGAGATGTGVSDDYDGVTRATPPDIGAYQYVA